MSRFLTYFYLRCISYNYTIHNIWNLFNHNLFCLVIYNLHLILNSTYLLKQLNYYFDNIDTKRTFKQLEFSSFVVCHWSTISYKRVQKKNVNQGNFIYHAMSKILNEKASNMVLALEFTRVFLFHRPSKLRRISFILFLLLNNRKL